MPLQKPKTYGIIDFGIELTCRQEGSKKILTEGWKSREETVTGGNRKGELCQVDAEK